MWFGRAIGTCSDLRTAPRRFGVSQIRVPARVEYSWWRVDLADLACLMFLYVPLSALVQGRFVTLTSGDEICWCSFLKRVRCFMMLIKYLDMLNLRVWQCLNCRSLGIKYTGRLLAELNLTDRPG